MGNIVRKSSFIISVPTKSSDNHYIFVHGYTGGADILNANLAEAINSNKINGLEKKEIDFLLDRGYLTTKTKEEELTYVSNLVEKIYKYYQKQLTVLIAPNLDCYFRCP